MKIIKINQLPHYKHRKNRRSTTKGWAIPHTCGINKKIIVTIFSLSIFLISQILTAQGKNNNAYIGYLYPSGAEKGTTTTVIAGGQKFNQAETIQISGEGVKISIIKRITTTSNINKEQRKIIADKIRLIWQKGVSELSDKDKKSLNAIERYLFRGLIRHKGKGALSKEKFICPSCNDPACLGCGVPDKEMPKSPFLFEIDDKSPRELIHIKSMLMDFKRKMQQNRQLREILILEVKVAKNAKIGKRELRIITKNGISNPRLFQIGNLPEINELEPNNNPHLNKLFNFSNTPKIKLPVTINGQIMPGDVDRFQFTAKKGEELVIKTEARSLIPYLADAVPGWFQPIITIFDKDNKEVLFVDDYGIYPAPIAKFIPPYSGKFELEIKDSIYRGREDFVYRISLSKSPFITNIFPLGAQVNSDTSVVAQGWNLKNNKNQLDTNPTKDQKNNKNNQSLSIIRYINEDTPYEISSLSECNENEPNNNKKSAMKITMPLIINGRIQKPGDIDTYKISGKKGDVIVVEVTARQLNSQLDSFIRVIDSSGKYIKVNDDYIQKDKFLHKDSNGLITHHADSYLMTTLPHTGDYYIQLLDTQNRGGYRYAYRLRISHPIPSFKLLITPSSLKMKKGGTAPITAYAIKKDGFDEDIKIAITDTKSGFSLVNNLISKGYDSATLILNAPFRKKRGKKQNKTPIMELKFKGLSKINDKTITTNAIPADNVMQAFLYRHLVPRKATIVSLLHYGRPIKTKVLNPQPIKIPIDGSVEIQIQVPKKVVRQGDDISIALYNPPKGISIKNNSFADDKLKFDLVVDKDIDLKRLPQYLILSAMRTFNTKPKKNQKAKRITRPLQIYIPIKIISKTL